MKQSELTGYPTYHDEGGPLGGPKAEREPLVAGDKSYTDVDDDISCHVERFPTWRWWVLFVPIAMLALAFVTTLGLIIATGIGATGINHPIGWGVFIINFVFWIGIGHAGTLISAILYLFEQKWRTAINRSAEAMTIFAVMVAGIFPALHTGRPWFAYWLLPIPNGRGPLWVNFNSPLLWDIFAISTYGTISLVFWYIGLVPDLATIRDRAEHPWRRKLYGLLSFGWTGSNRGWQHYESAYLMLAGLATPLVLSVHTIVSFDFAMGVIPGWHTTIFPPYFVAGAIFSGFAMVLTLLVIMRETFDLKDYVTINHLESMCKILLLTSLLVGIAYTTEFFMAWYSAVPAERYHFAYRMFGEPYWFAPILMYGCNVVVPQIMWFKPMRRNLVVIFIVSILVNVGMWFERYVIVVTSLNRDFVPSAWGVYNFKWTDIMLTVGSFGLFLMMFLLFCRVLPTVSMFEIKAVMDPDKAVKNAKDKSDE